MQEKEQEGFVILLRKLRKWEWYKDSNMVHLFIELLLSANYVPGKFMGYAVERGQLATGLHSLHLATGISVRSLRTCLKRLKTTGELTIQTTNRFSIITLCNYEHYQDKKGKTAKQNAKPPDTPPTNKRHSNDIQTTTIEQSKQDNNLTKEQEIHSATSVAEKYPFDSFWKIYGKPTERNICETKWNKLPDAEKELIMAHIPGYVDATPELQFRKNPATYLKRKIWQDGIMPINAKTVKKSAIEQLAETGSYE